MIAPISEHHQPSQYLFTITHTKSMSNTSPDLPRDRPTANFPEAKTTTKDHHCQDRPVANSLAVDSLV
jgi:hypothetical protein